MKTRAINFKILVDSLKSESVSSRNVDTRSHRGAAKLGNHLPTYFSCVCVCACMLVCVYSNVDIFCDSISTCNFF